MPRPLRLCCAALAGAGAAPAAAERWSAALGELRLGDASLTPQERVFRFEEYHHARRSPPADVDDDDDATQLAAAGPAPPPPADGYCHPGQPCWPSDGDIAALRAALSGSLLQPGDAGFRLQSKVLNGRFTARPALIAMVQGTADVQAALGFARAHNVRVSVKSTGHDYDGRCTAPDSVMIHVGRMKGITFDASGPSITVETGNYWSKVYKYMAGVADGKYVAVGGSVGGVGVVGWMQGGGCSPLARRHGLGVDNTLAFEMVTADGRVVNASAGENRDLWWAVRGGGGGSWGVITRITYRVHPDPGAMTVQVSVFAALPKNVAGAVGRWIAGAPDDVHYVWAIGENYVMAYFLGDDAGAAAAFEPLRQIPGGMHTNASFQSWHGYQKGRCCSPETGVSMPQYIMSTFLGHHSLAETDAAERVQQAGIFCDCIACGGAAAARVDANLSAVHPHFRRSTCSLDCWDFYRVLDRKDDYPSYIAKMDKWADEVMNSLGSGDDGAETGTAAFISEPQSNLVGWKQSFWADKYDRLLAVKRRWDPAGVFRVHHGVGSDEL